MAKHRLKIALFCHTYTNLAETVYGHISGIINHSEHNVLLFDHRGDPPKHFFAQNFDAVIIHYTYIVKDESYISRRFSYWLHGFKGLKLLFIQDEYRFINETLYAIEQIQFDAIFTCCRGDVLRAIYPRKAIGRAIRVPVLTGYWPDKWTPASHTRRINRRKFDIGYRAQKLSAAYGKIGFDKWNIGELVKERSRGSWLNVNISTQTKDRLYGEDWVSFLKNCKAVLGTESGSDLLDYDGKITKKINEFEAENKSFSFVDVERVFPEISNGLKLRAISPRIFEAVHCRTLLVLFEGKYSNFLKPGVHYFCLKKDLSNFEELKSLLVSASRMKSITDQAWRDLRENPRCSIEFAVKQMDTTIERLIQDRMRFVDSRLGLARRFDIKLLNWRRLRIKSFLVFTLISDKTKRCLDLPLFIVAISIYSLYVRFWTFFNKEKMGKVVAASVFGPKFGDRYINFFKGKSLCFFQNNFNNAESLIGFVQRQAKTNPTLMPAITAEIQKKLWVYWHLVGNANLSMSVSNCFLMTNTIRGLLNGHGKFFLTLSHFSPSDKNQGSVGFCKHNLGYALMVSYPQMALPLVIHKGFETGLPLYPSIVRRPDIPFSYILNDPYLLSARLVNTIVFFRSKAARAWPGSQRLWEESQNALTRQPEKVRVMGAKNYLIGLYYKFPIINIIKKKLRLHSR